MSEHAAPEHLKGAPGSRIDALIARAAWYRELGETWAAVGERVRRTESTVSGWPYEYEERWAYHTAVAREAIEEDRTRAAERTRRDLFDAAPEAVSLLRALLDGFAPQTAIEPQEVTCPCCAEKFTVAEVAVEVPLKLRQSAAHSLLVNFRYVFGMMTRPGAVGSAIGIDLDDLSDEDLADELGTVLRAIEGGRGAAE